MSKEIAKILVDIKSINFSFDKYFTLTSGLASPVYVDCRKIILLPPSVARSSTKRAF